MPKEGPVANGPRLGRLAEVGRAPATGNEWSEESGRHGLGTRALEFKMKKAAVLLIGLFFVLGACAKSSTPERPEGRAEEPIASPPPEKVDWENYSPTVQTEIDQLSAAKDCTNLQGLFEAADANSAAQTDLVGDGNTDLMAYIDRKLAEAGCYED